MRASSTEMPPLRCVKPKLPPPLCDALPQLQREAELAFVTTITSVPGTV